MAEPSVTPHDAVTTYRTLRITMVALVVLLAASFTGLWVSTGRHEDSISAYYFTATHAVFIAAVCAIGACLIAYKGRTASEEIVLDISGGLAFVVAFVPTDPSGVPKVELPTKADPFVGSTNNVVAAAIALSVGFALFGAIAWWKFRHPPGPTPRTRSITVPEQDNVLVRMANRLNDPISRGVDAIVALGSKYKLAKWILPALSVAYLGYGAWRLIFDSSYTDWAHGYAAVGMFGGIVLVAVYYAFYAASKKDSFTTRTVYVVLYLLIAGSMLSFLAWTLWQQVHARGPVDVFGTEVVVIALFAAFWIVQTIDLWDQEVKKCDACTSTAVIPTTAQ